jgi:hypothetical protein
VKRLVTRLTSVRIMNYVFRDIMPCNPLKAHVHSICWVKEYENQFAPPATCFMLTSCLAYSSSALKADETCSSLNALHSLTSQKIELLITAPVITIDIIQSEQIAVSARCRTSRLSPLELTDSVDGFQLTAPSGGC